MRHANQRRYPRTARLNELVQQILAEELERMDDDRLELVTVMRVEVDPDLRRATVFVDTPEGEARDDEVLAGLEQDRVRLQAAVARQARMKRTPQLTFKPDAVERGAQRVEEALRNLHTPDDG